MLGIKHSAQGFIFLSQIPTKNLRRGYPAQAHFLGLKIIFRFWTPEKFPSPIPTKNLRRGYPAQAHFLGVKIIFWIFDPGKIPKSFL